MPPDSVVCTSECADGEDGEHCQSKISCYNARNENGRWILTPTTTDQLDCAGDHAALGAGPITGQQWSALFGRLLG